MPKDVDYNVMMTTFINKQCAMVITGPWAMQDFKNEKMNIGVGEIPVVSATGLNPKPFVGVEVMMLSKKSSKKEKCIDIIKYFSSEDFQAKMIKCNHIPSKNSVYLRDDVRSNENFSLIEGFKKQAEKGYSLLTNVELSIGIWRNGAIFLDDYLSGKMTVEDAAYKAQVNAMNDINTYRNK